MIGDNQVCKCGHTRVWHDGNGERCDFHCGNPERCLCDGFVEEE